MSKQNNHPGQQRKDTTAEAPVTPPSAPAPEVIETASAPAPVAEAKPVTAATIEKMVAVEESAIEGLDSALKKATGSTRILFSVLRDYIVAMAPNRPVGVQEGCAQQVQLYRTLNNFLNSVDGNDFQEAFGIVLGVAHLERDRSFAETHLFRFFDNVSLSANEISAFQRLLNLIKLTADHRSRAIGLKQLNFGATVAGLSEVAQNKLASFYSI